MARQTILIAVLAVLVGAAAVYYFIIRRDEPSRFANPDYSMPYDDFTGTNSIEFTDDVMTNSDLSPDINGFLFVKPSGEEIRLKELQGDKNVAVVITRGNAGQIPCPYCSTQTSRLIANYKEFTDRNAEVVVVYPVGKLEDKNQLEMFLKATRDKLASPTSNVPFPVVLDVGLNVVDQLGIRANLSKPATYILDWYGQVRFAYVGSNVADRPSIKAIVQQLELVNEDG